MRASLIATTATLMLVTAGNLLALEWQVHEAKLAPGPLQRTADARFTFRNTGVAPVTIRSVQTNCDCLNAATDKLVYAPGESGQLTARFTTGDREGLYERAITVVASDSPAPQRLTVMIDVPRAAVVAPVNLLWPIGSAAESKSVDVRVADGIEITFSATYATNAAFSSKLETVTPGRRYRVLITPAATSAEANAAIRIEGRASTGENIVVSAYANVR